MERLKKALLSLWLLLLIGGVTIAQLPGSVNIDQLSDDQIVQYMNKAKLTGLSDAELEAKAKQSGLSDDQISKLKARVANLQTSKGSTGSPNASNNSNRTVSTSDNVGMKPGDFYPQKVDNGLEIYGSQLFSNANLTFEPNLRIATPRNYVLGVEDELKIDIFGYSEASYNVTVNPEGVIRLPNIGPIRVVGMTFDDAQKKIKQSLTKIYPGIASGNTSVQVSLGQIRTIRVTMIGEITKPGTYSLPSLATIANALYVSGGPNKTGSFRNIQLIRNGKTLVTFDLYDFLSKGDLNNNLVLQDDDIIKVSPYDIRVTLQGAIKHPAIFESKKGETLGDIITYGGGFTDNAYKETIRIIRLGKKEKEVVTIAFQDYAKLIPQSGDTAIIDSITNRFSNRVSIEGEVFHEGDFSLTSVPTLKDLLLQAGVKENAFKERGLIKRLQDNYTPEILNFNVSDILNGKTNIILKREDAVNIASIYNVREQYTISIDGEINKPGTYEYADSIKLQDFILLAGGFKDAASNSRIEISRRMRNSGGREKDTSTYATIAEIDLGRSLASNNMQAFTLQPFDIVSVRRNPSYKDQIVVSIEGEVLYPGQYSVSTRDEKISDLIRRAGGLRSAAYPEGAVLLRKTFENNSENAIADNKVDVIQNQSKSDSSGKEHVIKSLKDPQKLVGIRLDDILKNSNSPYNIMLNEGDVLRIPKKLETIQTFGGVYVSKKVIYSEGISFKKVIRESGGFTQEALRKRSYAVYPNGEIQSTHKTFIFFRSYPKIKPGTEVYVPLKKETKGLTTQEILGITGALVGIAGIVIGILNVSK